MRCEGGERQERRERRGRKDPLSRLTPGEKVGTSFYPLIVTTNAQPITQVFLGSTVPDGGRGREGEERQERRERRERQTISKPEEKREGTGPGG